MENHIGRDINENEVVHHINEIKSDNKVCNLKILGFGEHSTLHNKGRKHSEETKHKISEKAKQRLKDETNHPLYKDIDIEKLIKENKNGKSVRKICKENNISNATYYRKKRKCQK